MVSNTDHYISCKRVAVDTTSASATDSAVVEVMDTCRVTACRRRSCLLPPAVVAAAADRSDCHAVVSTCPPRPVTGWPPPRLSLQPEAAGPTATTPASQTNKRDTGPDSRQRNSTSWNGALARPTIRTFSCVRKSPCGSVSPSPEYR